MHRLSLISSLAMGTALAAVTPAAASPVRLLPPLRLGSLVSTVTPPDTTLCQKRLHISCYRPQQLQQAYDLAPLYAQGLNGTGRRIVVVDAFGSPTIRHDLAGFDQAFGLPAPPHFRIVHPFGPMPRYDSRSFSRVSWAAETSLDVEWAHAMAPNASIVLVEVEPRGRTTVDELTRLIKADHYVLDHHLGDVVSQSFGISEPDFAARRRLWPLHHVFTLARERHVTMVAASGDTGVAGTLPNGRCCYRHAVTTWPASDPYVTAVGGTKLHLDDAGNRTAPDTGWKDVAGASGGGVSTFFARPPFQPALGHRHRSVPDVSMSAAVTGSVLVYTSFRVLNQSGAGFRLVGGTSESAPLFAGVVAIADQAAHHRLGFLNPLLYGVGVQSGGIVDVVGHDNGISVRFEGSRRKHHISGHPAIAGYDLMTGLGTIDAARLVGALAAAPAPR